MSPNPYEGGDITRVERVFLVMLIRKFSNTIKEKKH